MKSRSFRQLATLLTATLAFGFFAMLPSAAFAAPVNVTTDPVDAEYHLGDAAVPLTATFTRDVDDGSYNPDQAKTVQWFWNTTGEVTDRSNPIGAPEGFDFDGDPQSVTTSTVPTTDAVGTRYYFAVCKYVGRLGIDDQEDQDLEAVSELAEIVVLDDPPLFEPRVFELPFTKIVEQGGTAEPGEYTFYFPVGFLGEIPDEDYFTVDAYSVATDGEGEYSGAVVVTVSDEDVLASVIETGFFVFEHDGGADGWEYSDADYYVQFSIADGIVFYEIHEVDGVVDNQVQIGDVVETMVFTNVYTADALTTPSTGDIAWIVLCVMAVLAIAGTAAIITAKRRQRVS
jgi:hypothetical protein